MHSAHVGGSPYGAATAPYPSHESCPTGISTYGTSGGVHVRSFLPCGQTPHTDRAVIGISAHGTREGTRTRSSAH
eukprot:5018244-Pyramimonas_sp.AAC.1